MLIQTQLPAFMLMGNVVVISDGVSVLVYVVAVAIVFASCVVFTIISSPGPPVVEE